MNLAMSAWNSSNGLRNVNAYDEDMWLIGIRVPNIQRWDYGYDTANRLTTITDNLDGTLSQTLTYDELDRLKTVTSNVENESYNYDASGNRTSQTVNGISSTFGIDPASYRVNSETSSGSTINYKYDLQGNLFGYGPGTPAQMFYYNGFDRLNGTYVGGLSAHYDVNPEGQRLRKYTSSTDTYFAPDVGGTLLAEDLNGDWYDYVWLNGRVVEVISNGGVYSLHDDQTGRPEVMTAPGSNTIAWKVHPLPFTSTAMTNVWGPFNLGFPGQYFDEESGLYYNGARDYSPGLGRYIESDPIGLAGGINTYVYVGNNSITRIDPTGLATYLLGVNGSLTFLGGGQLSFGIYFNPGLSGQNFGLGVYSSQGAAVGFNLGAGAYVGALNGSPCKLKGNTADVNGTFGPVQTSVSFDTSDGTMSGIVGATVGVPAGVSVSYSHTESFGVEDIAPVIQQFEFNAINTAVAGGRW